MLFINLTKKQFSNLPKVIQQNRALPSLNLLSKYNKTLIKKIARNFTIDGVQTMTEGTIRTTYAHAD